MRRPLGVLIVSLSLLSVSGVASGMDPTTVTPPVSTAACKGLPVTASLRTALRSAHHRAYARPFNGPPVKSTWYGRCGMTYYAMASFFHPGVGYTDQPEVFRRRVGRIWADRGDTGGEPCNSKKVPAALLKAWKYRC
jgi:hypothetical protein